MTNDPREILHDVAAKCKDDATALQLSTLADGSPSGTMRAFMEAHDGRTVTTVQVNRHNGTVWAPTGRTIDASRAGSVRLDGSARDYRGMRVIARTPGAVLVSDDWHTIAYLIED